MPSATPRCLKAEALVKRGIEIDVLLDRWVRVQDDLADVAKSFVSIITDKYVNENLPNLGDKAVSEMAELIQTVRPMAHDIVETTFRKALDEQISKAIGEASTYFDVSQVQVDDADERSAGNIDAEARARGDAAVGDTGTAAESDTAST